MARIITVDVILVPSEKFFEPTDDGWPDTGAGWVDVLSVVRVDVAFPRLGTLVGLVGQGGSLTLLRLHPFELLRRRYLCHQQFQ